MLKHPSVMKGEGSLSCAAKAEAQSITLSYDGKVEYMTIVIG